MEALAEKPVAPLLRNDQVDEMLGEKESLQRKMQSPHIEDKGTVADQLRRLNNQLESQRPRPYVGQELDTAVRREAELRAQWTQGMLSHEEMRKSPSGAVDRHIAWEKKNLRLIEEWQNIKRRLHAGDDSRESASIEQHRPTTSTMNMDGALIHGKQFYFGPINAGIPVTFSDAQIAALKIIVPDLADRLGSLTNRERAQVKDTLEGGGIGLAEPSAASIAGARGVEKREARKRTLSPAHKEAMRKGREAKAKKAA